MSLFKKNESLKTENQLFTSKDLIKITLPLVIQQILGVTVGAIDTLMVAYAGESAVSGVSLINTLDMFLFTVINALVIGGAVVVAQTLGRQDKEGARESAKQLLYTATIISIVMTILVLCLRKPLLSLLFGDVEADVMFNAERYFFFILFSFPLIAIELGSASIFRSAGNSMISMFVSLGANLLNIGGNAILIMGFGMGAAGAAISTLITRMISATVMLILITNKKSVIYIERPLHYKPDLHIIKRILHIGIPHGIENSMFQLGKLLTQTLVSSMGTAVIAANAVALTITNFQYMTGSACSNATITVVGQTIGAGEIKQAKRYSRIMLTVNYIMLWSVAIITLIFLRPILSAYDLSPDSNALASKLIVYHSICAIAIWPLGFMLPSVFRAASDVRFPLFTSLISMWVFRVAGSYLLAQETLSFFGLFSIPGFGMGLMGVWVAMTLDWFFRSLLYLTRYLSGRWLRRHKTN